MAAQSEVIRQSDLLNQLVLNRDTMEELGRVEVLWMYPQAHRVLGFICKSGFLGNQKLAFQLAQIDRIGDNGILTHSQPQKTEAEKVRRLESLIDHEVWSDEGSRIGRIIDCLFDLRIGQITHYLFVSGGWPGMVGGVYQLPTTKILSFGNRRVLVAEVSLSGFEIYQPGISQKLTEVSESFKEEVVEELSTFAKKAEVTTEQAKEQLHQLTEQARERARRLSQQFRQKAQVWNEQVKETTETLLEQAKEKSQNLTEQVKEGTHSLSRQVEEQIETLTMPEIDISEDELDDWDDWFDELEEDTENQTSEANTISEVTEQKIEELPNQSQTPATSPRILLKSFQPDPDDQLPDGSANNLVDDDDDDPWI